MNIGGADVEVGLMGIVARAAGVVVRRMVVMVVMGMFVMAVIGMVVMIVVTMVGLGMVVMIVMGTVGVAAVMVMIAMITQQERAHEIDAEPEQRDRNGLLVGDRNRVQEAQSPDLIADPAAPPCRG